jgi:hypothetical protein
MVPRSTTLLQWPPGPGAMALLAAALSLAVTLPTLAMLPFWGDEVITLRSLSLPFDKLVAERLRNAHSPVWFLAIQWLELDGQSRFLLRLPSALGSAVAAACMALVAYRLGGWRAALTLAVAFATMPAILVEAQDARPNAWHFACLGFFTLCLAVLLDHPRLARAALTRAPPAAARRLRWTWAGTTLAAIAVVAMLPLGALAVIAGDVAVLWCARRRACRRLLRPWFLLRLATLVVLLPLFIGLVDGFERRVGNYWPSPFSWDAIRAALKVAGGGAIDLFDPNYFLGPDGNRALYWSLALVLLLGLWLGRRRRSFSLLIVLAFLPQLILILLSLNTSLLVGRYFAVSTPAMLTLGAVGVAAIWSRRPPLAIPALAIAALLFLQALDAMHQLSKPRFDLAVDRLRAGGVTDVTLVARNYFQGSSALYQMQDVPLGHRAKPFQGFLAATVGKTLWIIAYPDKTIAPTWRIFAEASGIGVCKPAVAGLNLLAIARDEAALAASCPDTVLSAPARAAAAP